MMPDGTSYYAYYDETTDEWIKYDGKDRKTTYIKVDRRYAAFDEVVTEYLTRKIYGNKRDENIYNVGTDTLEKIVKIMESKGVNAEKFLMDSYTGEDTDAFGKKMNETLKK